MYRMFICNRVFWLLDRKKKAEQSFFQLGGSGINRCFWKYAYAEAVSIPLNPPEAVLTALLSCVCFS